LWTDGATKHFYLGVCFVLIMSDDMLPVGEIDIEPHSIIQADATELPYEDESFHAIVTDPPYGLAFMGKTWDQFEPKEYQEFCENWGEECLRVLKPGGHMLAFSGTRTYHRMVTGVEDAGFEIRDKIDYLYGSGFAKGLDVSKAIDKQLGVEDEREKAGVKPGHEEFADRDTDGHLGGEDTNEGYKRPWMEEEDASDYHYQTKPASEEAEEWHGWKTALKPAHEPIVVARKPLEEDTVAEQVMATGTGALNIDGARIALPKDDDLQDGIEGRAGGEMDTGGSDTEWGFKRTNREPGKGRYPANIILDIEAAQMLDEEVGDLHESTKSTRGGDLYGGYESEGIKGAGESIAFGDSGGPSRYFYTSKASKSERTANGRIDNNHPTIKPVDLMQYLVRLVTAEGQKVCDPFLGSGTTLLACEEENRVGYGSDMNKEYCDIATKRLGIRMGTELGSFMDY